jgi:hypothetical protein
LIFNLFTNKLRIIKIIYRILELLFRKQKRVENRSFENGQMDSKIPNFYIMSQGGLESFKKV